MANLRQRPRNPIDQMTKALKARFNGANNFGGTMNRAFSAGGLVLFTNPRALPQANAECCAFGAKRNRRLATPRFKSNILFHRHS